MTVSPSAKTGIRAEFTELPSIYRKIMWITVFFLIEMWIVMLVLLPVIFFRYGWDYGGAFVTTAAHRPGGGVIGQVWADAWRIGMALALPGLACLGWSWYIKNSGPI